MAPNDQELMQTDPLHGKQPELRIKHHSTRASTHSLPGRVRAVWGTLAGDTCHTGCAPQARAAAGPASHLCHIPHSRDASTASGFTGSLLGSLPSLTNWWWATRVYPVAVFITLCRRVHAGVPPTQMHTCGLCSVSLPLCKLLPVPSGRGNGHREQCLLPTSRPGSALLGEQPSPGHWTRAVQDLAESSHGPRGPAHTPTWCLTP